jgi:uncharacterized RDD family membrane protein YckC
MTEFPAPRPPEQPGPPPPTGGPSGPRAGFWRRFGGALIDALIIGIVGGIFQVILGRGPGSAIGLAIGVGYYGYLEGSNSGQTIGKRALGIRVIDFNNGGPIGFGRAVIRYFGRWVSAIPCGLGYFWMLWDKEKQCWHDKFATDVVVPVDAYPVSSWPN